MEPSNEWETRFRIAMGANWIVSLACQVAIIIVVATVVRRQRPDAWMSILAWAIASSALWFWGPMTSLLRPFLSTSGEGGSAIGAYYKGQVLNQAIAIPLHVLVIVLFIRGLVKLAQPPKPIEVPNEPPYR